MTLTVDKTFRHFDGEVRVVSHDSSSTKTKMTFAVFLPPQALREGKKVPVLFWLSGLTCTWENFGAKSGFARHAAKHGIAVVMPDTSPRGEGVPSAEEGEAVSWDFGLGAGFYVNATRSPFSTHYRMFDYVTKELPEVLSSAAASSSSSFSGHLDMTRLSIAGHSMGGLGALNCFFKSEPGTYKAISVFAPICNPSNCPWGQKAFTRYFGKQEEAGEIWKQHDPCELVRGYSGPPVTIQVEQGLADDFLTKGQLLPEALKAASEATAGKVTVDYRAREGYDHSYWFIASFLEEVFDNHAKAFGLA